jgi:hypothetical protein
MSGFIPRIIGKAERVSTVLADVLGKPASLRQEMDVMARDYADRRMADLADAAGRRLLDVFQEGVTAEAGVLFKSVARRHVTNTVTEEPAEVAHLLLERWRRRIRIPPGVEQQRMPALRADIFVTTVAIGELLVVVLAEETRQRMPDARDRSIFREVFRPAAAPPPAAAGLLEDVVIDVMAPEETRQFG